jgi:hypothetical protein
MCCWMTRRTEPQASSGNRTTFKTSVPLTIEHLQNHRYSVDSPIIPNRKQLMNLEAQRELHLSIAATIVRGSSSFSCDNSPYVIVY